MNKFWRDGEPFVWLSGAALAMTLLFTVILIIVVMVNGLGVFWPHKLVENRLADGSIIMGQLNKTQEIPDSGLQRSQFKIGNRDLYGLDFRWIDDAKIAEQIYPRDAVVLERMEYGNFFGFLKSISVDDSLNIDGSGDDWARFVSAWKIIEEKNDDIREIDKEVTALAGKMARLELKIKKLKYDGVEETDPSITFIADELSVLRTEFEQIVANQSSLYSELKKNSAVFEDASGIAREIPFVDIVRFYKPNSMSFFSKIGFYASKIVELLTADPRESNTEGGLLPAIFGTVTLIFIMSILSFPLGVIAGIYLREYAKEGFLVRLVRIAVNNLAGIPSIVYGIFGLGFFIYGVGGAIDRIFFPERLPDPTFGTGGILWAGLTLGLLTVPIVIVSTEEALGQIPKGISEGSLSLGSTKFQTLIRLLLPMASPGIMTGFILAMARAAGEVAPLMITGVVKLAPSLPIDGTFPFFHFERKFMHLGFHIYDIGFQSPNVEAAKPMVFITTLLLVLVVLIMSSLAIYFRNKMSKKYSISSI